MLLPQARMLRVELNPQAYALSQGTVVMASNLPAATRVTSLTHRERSSPADNLSVCFSKGLLGGFAGWFSAGFSAVPSADHFQVVFVECRL